MDGKRILTALAAGLGGIETSVLRRGRAPRCRDGGWPVNFAHRGASLRAPENTLESFRLAAGAGAGGMELDVRMTSDGRVAVIHDDSVSRTTDGVGLVREMTLREVQNLDAGYRFTLDGGATYPYRGRGTRVPELEVVLREFPDYKINIDVKEARSGIEAAVLATIEETGAEERTLVVSEMKNVIKRFRELAGDKVSTGASRPEIGMFYILSRLRLESFLRPGYAALQVPVRYGRHELVTQRFLEAAQSRGVRLDVWTIDDAREMRRLLDLGVDVIMTNRPEVLEGVLAERRRREG